MKAKKRALSTSSAIAMSALLAVGMGVAIWLVRIKLRLGLDPNYQSSCNFGDKLNCDAVQTSSQSVVFGYPLALWGFVAYGVLLVAVWMARRPATKGRPWLAILSGLAVLFCLHSAWLAWISSTVIGTWCLFCMAMYAVNLSVAILALVALRRQLRLPGLLSEAFHPPVLLGFALSAALITAVAIPSYLGARKHMTQARIEQVKAELAKAKILEQKPPSKKQPTAKSSASNSPSLTSPSKSAPSKSGTAPQGVLTHPSGFRYSAVVLRKGRSYFEVPVTEADYPDGPANAPVTVVMFADYECGYCRVLARNMKSLRKKFTGKVRWVFKNFPLDHACNKVMKGTQHPNACDAAKAANCAGAQGKYWPMHDNLYESSRRLNKVNLRLSAQDVGVPDMEAWDRCFEGPEGHKKTTLDTRYGRFARISGTPRTYINGHLVPGVVATEVLDYYITAAIAQAKQTASVAASDPGSKALQPATDATRHDMVRAHSAEGEFWIDAFEGSLDAKGRALSVKGARPAEVSWYEAKAACERAGKRLCREREWISACTGAAAVDDNHDGDLTNDKVEGNLFPYGPFYEGGRCHDDGKSSASARPTGSMNRCVSRSGIYDQSGNLAEWSGLEESTALLTGTDFRWGAKATCLHHTDRFGPGFRNTTTGFRCCADAPVPALDSHPVLHLSQVELGQPAPAFKVLDGAGKVLNNNTLKGKVAVLSFFASWCNPCRVEIPKLQKFFKTHPASGLAMLAIGVDKKPGADRAYIEKLKLSFPVGYDPKAVSMGRFGVRGMPAAFLIDPQGRVVHKLVGINAKKLEAFKAATLELLKSTN